jgi:uncharacterized surface protein with fasciclin (FAS1) repeats
MMTITPPEDKTITGIASKNADLSILGSSIDKSRAVTLQGTGPFTVFAPTMQHLQLFYQQPDTPRK